MKTSRKQELKGAFKAIVAIAILGLMIGIGVATTLMSDEGFFKDGNEILVEGDYTTWTHKGNITLPGGMHYAAGIGFQLDDVNDVLSVSYADSSHPDPWMGYNLFATYNLNDLSVIFNSTTGQDYLEDSSYVQMSFGTQQGNAQLWTGALSLSQQTYLLLLRNDYVTVAVWRAGSELWLHNTTAEVGTSYIECGGISNTGKWILLVGDADGGDETLIIYEGS